METTVSWTDERVEMLKKLWAEGLSASQIAAKLGGVSRNAVIGKVHRLKLSGRAKSTKPAAPRVRRTPNSGGSSRPASSSSGSSSASSSSGSSVGSYSMPQRTPPSVTHTIGATALKQDHEVVAYKAPQRDTDDVVAPMPLKLKLVDINEHTCKWPFGDPLQGEFYFCGHGNEEGSPYCKYHSKLAFQQPQDRRRSR
jgi:GcrA cell cycle regulator